MWLSVITLQGIVLRFEYIQYTHTCLRSFFFVTLHLVFKIIKCGVFICKFSCESPVYQYSSIKACSRKHIMFSVIQLAAPFQINRSWNKTFAKRTDALSHVRSIVLKSNQLKINNAQPSCKRNKYKSWLVHSVLNARTQAYRLQVLNPKKYST